MKNLNKKSSKGISVIGFLILAFILILILSYFKISIRSVVESPEAQDNITYVRGAGVSVWDRYLKEPANKFWDKVVVDLLWGSFTNNLQRIKDGVPTEMEENAPGLDIGSRVKVDKMQTN